MIVQREIEGAPGDTWSVGGQSSARVPLELQNQLTPREVPLSGFCNVFDTDDDYAPYDEDKLRQREYELFIYNLTFAFLHLFQAIVSLALGLSATNLGKFKLPITTLFVYWDLGYPVQKLKVLGFLPFVAATSGFAWQTAVAHFSVVIGFPCYVADLRRYPYM